MSKYLLNIDANAKTVKGQKKGYMTGVLYLAPANLAGPNICAFASPQCKASCLNTAGRGAFSNVQKARIAKTKLYHADKVAFGNLLAAEALRLYRKAKRNGLTPVLRLNGTSDIAWENTPIIAALQPLMGCYDYTKNPFRMKAFLAGKLPANYHLTFSLSENNMKEAVEILALGGNVAMVFDTKKGHKLPKTHLGYKVVDGDVSDLRFLDPKGVIVGLRAKGKARKAKVGGFIQPSNICSSRNTEGRAA